MKKIYFKRAVLLAQAVILLPVVASIYVTVRAIYEVLTVQYDQGWYIANLDPFTGGAVRMGKVQRSVLFIQAVTIVPIGALVIAPYTWAVEILSGGYDHAWDVFGQPKYATRPFNSPVWRGDE